MKKSILLFLLLASPLFAELKYATVTFDSSNSYKIENPRLLFGCFFEFMNEFINGAEGLWAQELYNRGFDRRNTDHYADKWLPINPQSENRVKLLNGGYNENGVYYQNLSNSNNSLIGIKQDIYFDGDKGGDFYIYLKNNAPEPSRFILLIASQTDNSVLFIDSIDVESSEWKKYSFKIPPFISGNRIAVALCLRNKGNIDLDEVSLMPSDNVNGVRKEFFDMFASWRPGVIRYPGGYFADTEHSHLDFMIGDIDKRHSPQLLGGYYQRMDFGLNEFMTLCRSVGAEPHLVVNLALGSPQESADWVEYCNGSIKSKYGKKRSEDGFPAPYNVKYWELGNEQWDENWMLPKYVEHYDSMVVKDPNIMGMVDGDMWRGKEYLLKTMGYTAGKSSIYSWHLFIGLKQKFMNLEDSVRTFNMVMCWSYILKETLKDLQNCVIENNLYPPVKQGITEHSFLWGDVMGNQDTTFRNSTLEAGLYQMSCLLGILRYFQTTEMYEKTFGFGHIRIGYDKRGKRIFYPTPFHTVTDFMANNSGDIIYKTNVESPAHSIPFYGGDAYVDVGELESLASSKGDTLYVYLINGSMTDSLSTSIINSFNLDTSNIWGYELKSSSIYDRNTPDEPNKIDFKKKKIDSLNNIILEPHSGLLVKAVVKSVKDTVLVKNFYISPNPVKDYLTISTTGYGNIQSLKIYDFFGNEIIGREKVDACETLINLDYIAPGAYFIEIKTENEKRTLRFIKE